MRLSLRFASRSRGATVAAGAAAAFLVLPAGAAWAQAKNGAIAFSAKRAGDRALFTRSPDGSQLRVVQTGGRADHAVFSPGGRRLAFTKYGPLGAQIWIGYVDGTGLRQLTPGPSETMPGWSPTGEDVVFARGAAGSRDLYRTRADGTVTVRLTASARNDDSPSWSVRNEIAFVRGEAPDGDVYVVSSGGGVARRLTRSRNDDAAPAWSPTGRTLVFARGKRGRHDLYVIRADGTGLRRLTTVPGDETEPTFSPDGTRIAFTHRHKGVARLYLMKVKGKAVETLPSRSRRVRRLTSGRSAARNAGWQPTGLDPVVAAAGDIACDPASSQFNGGAGLPGLCRQKLTSDLLLRMDLASILVPGDLQYEVATLGNFMQSFHPTWGRLKPLIRPAPGNHEFYDPGAAGYFDYFNGPGVARGAAGSRGEGWYSFEVGSWHVIALNSECEYVGGCEADSPQVRWLRADLAAHPTPCTLAYFHGPRFTSGRYGDHSEAVKPLWDVLYAAGADVVLSGHEHFYERFGPQTPAGAFDPTRGIRQFTIGMGGKSRHGFITIAPNSELRDNRTIGVFQMTLREGRYDWRLVRAPTGGTADGGSAACH